MEKERLLQVVRKAICGLLPVCVANVVAERVAEALCREMEG